MRVQKTTRKIAAACLMMSLGFAGSALAACEANWPEAKQWPDVRQVAACAKAADDEQITIWMMDLGMSNRGAEASTLQQALFDEQRRRGKLSERSWGYRLVGLINAWDWQAAHSLVAEPDAVKLLGKRQLPKTQVADAALDARSSAWAFDLERNALVQRALGLEDGPRIVVVMTPGCGFCGKAAKAIKADAELNRIFTSCSIWATDADANFQTRYYTDWQRTHGFEPLLVRDWAKLGVPQLHSTPIFYVMDKGRITDKISGWPPEGRRDELLAAVKRIDTAGQCRAVS